MARHPDGSLIDPHGGLADLRAGVLRHVSPAFSEDPLRVLRVARFAARLHARGFTVATETMDLMRNISGSGELAVADVVLNALGPTTAITAVEHSSPAACANAEPVSAMAARPARTDARALNMERSIRISSGE